MGSLSRAIVLVSILSASAGAAGALAASEALRRPQILDPGDLPGFEERFVAEFGIAAEERPLVRSILREYRERRREIEGDAAATARTALVQAGKEVDWKLRGILPPPRRRDYDLWLARAGQ